MKTLKFFALTKNDEKIGSLQTENVIIRWPVCCNNNHYRERVTGLGTPAYQHRLIRCYRAVAAFLFENDVFKGHPNGCGKFFCDFVFPITPRTVWIAWAWSLQLFKYDRRRPMNNWRYFFPGSCAKRVLVTSG